MEPDRDEGDVVLVIFGNKPSKKLVAQPLERETGDVGEYSHESADTFVEIRMTVFDEPVRVKHNRVAFGERNHVLVARRQRIDTEHQVLLAVEKSARAHRMSR